MLFIYETSAYVIKQLRHYHAKLERSYFYISIAVIASLTVMYMLYVSN